MTTSTGRAAQFSESVPELVLTHSGDNETEDWRSQSDYETLRTTRSRDVPYKAPHHFRRMRGLRERLRQRHRHRDEVVTALVTQGTLTVPTRSAEPDSDADSIVSAPISIRRSHSLRANRWFRPFHSNKSEPAVHSAGLYPANSWTNLAPLEVESASLRPTRSRNSILQHNNDSSVFRFSGRFKSLQTTEEVEEPSPVTDTDSVVLASTPATSSISLEISRINKEETERLKQQLFEEKKSRLRADSQLVLEKDSNAGLNKLLKSELALTTRLAGQLEEADLAKGELGKKNAGLKIQLEEERRVIEKLRADKKAAEGKLEETKARSAAHVRETLDLGIKLAEEKRDSAELKDEIDELSMANSDLGNALTEQVEATRAAVEQFKSMATTVNRYRSELSSEKLVKSKLFRQLVDEANDKMKQLGHAQKVVADLREQLRCVHTDLKLKDRFLEQQSHDAGVQSVKDRQEIAALERRLAAVYGVNRQLNELCARKELLGRQLPGDELVNMMMSSEAGRLSEVVRRQNKEFVEMREEYENQVRSLTTQLKGLMKRIAFLEKVSGMKTEIVETQERRSSGSLSRLFKAANASGDEVRDTRQCLDTTRNSSTQTLIDPGRNTTDGYSKLPEQRSPTLGVSKGKYLRRYLKALSNNGDEIWLEYKDE